jgi:maleylpyruvate isomerase
MPEISAANATDAEMAARLGEIAAAHARLRAQAAGFDEAAAHEPIALPGWTRAHVLFHLGDLSRAFARQAEYAVAGKTIEVYDGGRPARNRRIEENHVRSIEWLREYLDGGLDAVEKAWSGLSAADWELLCSYRDSNLAETQLAWWRETELHSVDLLAGYRPEDWSPPLSAHVVTFLRSRLAAEPGVELRAGDTGEVWTVGEGELSVIRGDVRVLAGWLSGRPAAELPATDSSAELPEPGDWP